MALIYFQGYDKFLVEAKILGYNSGSNIGVARASLMKRVQGC